MENSLVVVNSSQDGSQWSHRFLQIFLVLKLRWLLTCICKPPLKCLQLGHFSIIQKRYHPCLSTFFDIWWWINQRKVDASLTLCQCVFFCLHQNRTYKGIYWVIGSIFGINPALIFDGPYSSIFRKIEGPIIKIKCTVETWSYEIFFE